MIFAGWFSGILKGLLLVGCNFFVTCVIFEKKKKKKLSVILFNWSVKWKKSCTFFLSRQTLQKKYYQNSQFFYSACISGGSTTLLRDKLKYSIHSQRNNFMNFSNNNSDSWKWKSELRKSFNYYFHVMERKSHVGIKEL